MGLLLGFIDLFWVYRILSLFLAESAHSIVLLPSQFVQKLDLNCILSLLLLSPSILPFYTVHICNVHTNPFLPNSPFELRK